MKSYVIKNEDGKTHIVIPECKVQSIVVKKDFTGHLVEKLEDGNYNTHHYVDIDYVSDPIKFISREIGENNG